MPLIDRIKRITPFTIACFAVAGACYLAYLLLSRQVIQYSQTQFLLGTSVRIDICAQRRDHKKVLEAFDRAWQRVQTIDARLSTYKTDSDISKINASYPRAIKVHSETADVLRMAKDYCYKTNGSFDITVVPLMDLWKTAQEKNQWPSSDLVSMTSSAVGCDKVKVLQGDYVQLMHAQTAIDLSAVGQGYAADEAARVLRQQGFKDFLADMGGEIVAAGCNARNRPWRIGVKDPSDPSRLVSVVIVGDQAVSTSGNYEKYYEILGKKYSHIIDPRSGYPQEDIVSATIIDKSATQADILSTVVCVLGRERGLALLGFLAPQAGVFIVEQKTSGQLKSYQNDAYRILADAP